MDAKRTQQLVNQFVTLRLLVGFLARRSKPTGGTADFSTRRASLSGDNLSAHRLAGGVAVDL